VNVAVQKEKEVPVHILSERDEAVRELLRYRDEVRRKAGNEKQKIA
jgi:hypothetical protein